MKKENIQILAFILIIILLGAFFILSPGQEKGDVQLCHKIFLGLLTGRQSVEEFMDWDHLKVIGLDVGALYSKLPDQKQKSDFRREFFRSLSRSFQMAGGRPQAYTNWRIKEKDSSKTIVAVYYVDKAKTLLFTLTGDEKKKLTLVQWEGEAE